MSDWLVAVWLVSAFSAAGWAAWHRRTGSAIEIAEAVVSGVLAVTVLAVVASWVVAHVVLNPE